MYALVDDRAKILKNVEARSPFFDKNKDKDKDKELDDEVILFNLRSTRS
jgi:hypothetical protein